MQWNDMTHKAVERIIECISHSALSISLPSNYVYYLQETSRSAKDVVKRNAIQISIQLVSHALFQQFHSTLCFFLNFQNNPLNLGFVYADFSPNAFL